MALRTHSNVVRSSTYISENGMGFDPSRPPNTTSESLFNAPSSASTRVAEWPHRPVGGVPDTAGCIQRWLVMSYTDVSLKILPPAMPPTITTWLLVTLVTVCPHRPEGALPAPRATHFNALADGAELLRDVAVDRPSVLPEWCEWPLRPDTTLMAHTGVAQSANTDPRHAGSPRQ